MKSKERVLSAINHVQPDRAPTNLQVVNEAQLKLMKHFNTDDFDVVMEALEIDCRYAGPSYSGPEPEVFPDGSFEGWGGSRIKIINNQFGSYEEVAKYAIDEAKTPEDVDRLLKLSDPDAYDYSIIPESCRKYKDYCIFAGDCSVFYYTTSVRSMENLFIDMSLNRELAKHIIKRVSDWLMAYHERILDAGRGKLDVMYLGSDFSTQFGLMMSLDMFREYFREPVRKFIELGKSYGTKIFFHICGSAYGIIPELIDLGVDILDPVQTTAANMEPERLKREFGDRLTFHGAVNTQRIMPGGTPDEVRKEARELVRILGKDGGYILTSCHHIQADVPLENILALYEPGNR